MNLKLECYIATEVTAENPYFSHYLEAGHTLVMLTRAEDSVGEHGVLLDLITGKILVFVDDEIDKMIKCS